MSGHLFGHAQGHVTGVFRPYPMPTGTAPTGGPGGNGGILLETGGFYILLESGDYILLE